MLIDLIANAKHRIIFDIFFSYFLFHHLSFRIFSIPSFILLTFKGYFKLFIILFIIFIQRMVSLMVILFSTKCLLFVYMYIDLLKPNAYKLFENSDADVCWLLFLKKPTCCHMFLLYQFLNEEQT